MDLPTLRQLAYAVAVADHRHFTEAAEAMFVSQPGLSGQIQALEHRLGVQLFERSSRGVRPTPVGDEVVERSRRILRQAEELVQLSSQHQDTVRGRLRVAAIPTMAPYLLPALTRLIRSRWAGADLELIELRTESMIDAFDDGRCDLGLLAVPYDTGSVETTAVIDEPFLLVMPIADPLTGRTTVDFATLQDLPMLLLEEGHCLRDHAAALCDVAAAGDRSEIRGASLATLAQMVAAGMGYTLLPATALEVETRVGAGVAAVPFAAPRPGRTIALAWRSTDPRREHFAELVDPLRAAVRSIIA